MKYIQLQHLKNADFKRYTGVSKPTFDLMISSWNQYYFSASDAGRRSKLSPPDQILVALQYWREYRTYFHISLDWGLSESTVCRIVHRVEKVLLDSGQFRLKGKKSLRQDDCKSNEVLLDVTETPIERPLKNQEQYYSGKKKQHTLKCQVTVDKETLEIICLFVGKGSNHDFYIFKQSKLKLHPQTKSYQDSGYQGIAKYHKNSVIPHKKRKNQQLTASQKQENQALSKERIRIEHVNRSLKRFKIIQGRYRNRARGYERRCNLIAAIYNHELKVSPQSNQAIDV